MTDRVDSFESIFKRADRDTFGYAPLNVGHVVLLTDLDEGRAAALHARLRPYLKTLGTPRWTIEAGAASAKLADLLQRLDDEAVDLVVTHRNLGQRDKNTPHSLGVVVDTLTQASDTPILVLPDAAVTAGAILADTNSVMVMTDHLTANDRLINYGILLTEPGGKLHLCHVEDDATFDHYMHAIECIPELDTRATSEAIRAELLRRPHNYIQSCIDVLRRERDDIAPQTHVGMGHTLSDYRRLIEALKADVLIVNTKDHGQLAMHGSAYMIGIEFRDLPILML